MHLLQTEKVSALVFEISVKGFFFVFGNIEIFYDSCKFRFMNCKDQSIETISCEQASKNKKIFPQLITFTLTRLNVTAF